MRPDHKALSPVRFQLTPQVVCNTQFYDERLPQTNNGTEAIMFAIEFDAQGPMQESSPHLGESPLDKALRLVRAELGQTENRNQLNHYLMEFHVSSNAAITEPSTCLALAPSFR